MFFSVWLNYGNYNPIDGTHAPKYGLSRTLGCKAAPGLLIKLINTFWEFDGQVVAIQYSVQKEIANAIHRRLADTKTVADISPLTSSKPMKSNNRPITNSG
jgi:hypothetical protein